MRSGNVLYDIVGINEEGLILVHAYEMVKVIRKN